MPEASLQKLYETGSQFYDLGDYNTFKSKMQVDGSRQKFYGSLSQHFDLGDYNTFQSKVSMGELQVPELKATHSVTPMEQQYNESPLMTRFLNTFYQGTLQTAEGEKWADVVPPASSMKAHATELGAQVVFDIPALVLSGKLNPVKAFGQLKKLGKLGKFVLNEAGFGATFGVVKGTNPAEEAALFVGFGLAGKGLGAVAKKVVPIFKKAKSLKEAHVEILETLETSEKDVYVQWWESPEIQKQINAYETKMHFKQTQQAGDALNKQLTAEEILSKGEPKKALPSGAKEMPAEGVTEKIRTADEIKEMLGPEQQALPSGAYKVTKEGVVEPREIKNVKNEKVDTKGKAEIPERQKEAGTVHTEDVAKEVKIPEFKADTEAAAFGAKHKGNKQVIEALRKKEADARAAFKAEKDLYKKPKLQIESQKYMEARQVAEGTMDEVVPGVKKISEVKSGKDFTKGVLKAVKEDLKSETGAMGKIDNPYRNLEKFLGENKMRLTEEEREALIKFTTRLVKTKTMSTAEKNTKMLDHLKKFETIEKTQIPKEVPELKKTKWHNFREKIEDSRIYMKLIQELPGVQVSKGVHGKGGDPYGANKRFYGRVDQRTKELRTDVDKLDREVINTANKLEIKDDVLYKEVNEYLISRHAPERNAVLGEGAAGRTNAEAKEALNKLKDSGHFEDVEKIANQLQKINNRGLDILLDGGVIDQRLYNTLRAKYKNHVPLQRIMEEDIDEAVNVITGGKGINVKGSGLKRAKGSEREVDDVALNIITNIAKFTNIAEKNKVAMETLNFARNNQHLKMFEVNKPRIIASKKGIPIYEKVTDPRVMVVRENGKPVHVTFKDKRMAEMYKATNKEELGWLMSKVNAFTRFYSGLATRFNPEFPIPNIVRDTQEMTTFLASREGIGFSGAAKTVKDIPKSWKGVYDYHFGKKDSEGAKLYKQMLEDGGSTGGLSLSTKEKVKLDFDHIKKINRSNPRKAAHETVEFVDSVNQLFEDATRFSAYQRALKLGMTREEAAVLAKEATIDFNKKGTEGPMINALYMFANASIQGSAKMLRAMKKPKVAGAVISGVGMSTLAVNNWNTTIDPDWTNKVSEYDRKSNLLVVLPSDNEGINYIKIPVSWGLKPIKVMFDNGYDAYTGKERDPFKMTESVITSVLDGYNPLGGSNIRQIVTPTILDLPSDIWANEAWHGGKLKPDNFKRGTPEYLKYFKSLKETTSGQAAIKTTEILSENTDNVIDMSPEDLVYVIESLGGGTGRFGSRVFDTVTSIGKGEKPETRKVPVTNRFYKSVSADQVKRYAISKKNKELIERLEEENAIDSIHRTRAAQDYLDKFKELKTSQERKLIIREMYNTDPRILDTFLKFVKYDERGLTPGEKRVMLLQNPIRAKYMIEVLNKEKTEEAKKKKIVEFVSKKMMTKGVIEEMIKQGYKHGGSK